MSKLSLAQKLSQQESQLIELKESLKEYLYTNRGNTTTNHSDKSIIRCMESIENISHNIGYYKAAIECGRV